MPPIDPESVLTVDQARGSVTELPPWEELVASAGVSSLVVVAASRLGRSLASEHSAEDVVQEALLRAWRDRGAVQWRGVRAFRSWLLTLIDHSIADLRDRADALKRGGRGIGATGSDENRNQPAPIDGAGATSQTPSRVALHGEQAAAMLAALQAVPDDCREVVRLRLFEEMTATQIGACLHLGESAVRHRLRRGAAHYRQALSMAFSTLAATMTETGSSSASMDG